jgi:hypothetical protein
MKQMNTGEKGPPITQIPQIKRSAERKIRENLSHPRSSAVNRD